MNREKIESLLQEKTRIETIHRALEAANFTPTRVTGQLSCVVRDLKNAVGQIDDELMTLRVEEFGK